MGRPGNRTFNGPLTLLFDPAVQVIAAGNPCILKSLRVCPPQASFCSTYSEIFDPRSVTAVTGSKEEVTELLKLPFDFIFSPAASRWARSSWRRLQRT